MKYRTITLLIGATLALLVLLVVFQPEKMISPGRLIDAHSELNADCFACHTPLLGSRPQKCIACHEVAEIGKKTTKGLVISGEKKNVAFHQQLLEDDCVACHSDHNGVKAFRPIGQFSHKLLEPVVIKECNGCHSNPGDALHQKIDGNCSSCHIQQRWTPATFDHDKYFRFDKHHRSECKTCHIENDYTNYTCYGCHKHSRSKIREEHVEEGIYDYETCIDCHRSGDEHEAKSLWRANRGKSSNGDSRYYRDKSEHDSDHHHEDHDD